jgi:hypothetical protein
MIRKGFLLPFCALFSLSLLAACGDSAKSPGERALKSAGGLSESRLPGGYNGATPAPTSAEKKDKTQEDEWHKAKNAKRGEQPPTDTDHPAY